jgi:hypothetical protein
LVTLQAQAEVHPTSSAATANYCEIVSQLAPATNISFHDANWENYEDLLDPLGEANCPPISDNEVELQVLTQISTGENQLIFEGFYLDGGVTLGGWFDANSRRAAWVFIIGKSRQLDTVGEGASRTREITSIAMLR